MARLHPFRFSTKYKDEETGLVLYQLRAYRPDLGRWLKRDPFAENGSINLNAFVGNKAFAYVDYLGREDLPLPTPRQPDLNPGNATPGATPIPTGDGEGSATFDGTEKTTNPNDVIEDIKKQAKGDCCVKLLTLVGHSNGKNSFRFVVTGEAPIFGADQDAANAINQDNADAFFEQLSSEVSFCAPCYIYMLGCGAGLTPLPQKLASATGCKVFAPNTYCSPDNTSPWKSELELSIPPGELDNYPGGLEPLPGGSSTFSSFEPLLGPVH